MAIFFSFKKRSRVFVQTEPAKASSVVLFLFKDNIVGGGGAGSGKTDQRVVEKLQVI